VAPVVELDDEYWSNSCSSLFATVLPGVIPGGLLGPATWRCYSGHLLGGDELGLLHVYICGQLPFMLGYRRKQCNSILCSALNH
jgi:hypothetical protein